MAKAIFSRESGLFYMFNFFIPLSHQQRLSSLQQQKTDLQDLIPCSSNLWRAQRKSIKMIKRLLREVGMRMSLEEKIKALGLIR